MEIKACVRRRIVELRDRILGWSACLEPLTTRDCILHPDRTIDINVE